MDDRRVFQVLDVLVVVKARKNAIDYLLNIFLSSLPFLPRSLLFVGNSLFTARTNDE